MPSYPSLPPVLVHRENESHWSLRRSARYWLGYNSPSQLTTVEIEAQRDQAFKKAERERDRGEVLEKQERCKAVERTASAASKLVPALLRVVVSSKQRVLTAPPVVVVVLLRSHGAATDLPVCCCCCWLVVVVSHTTTRHPGSPYLLRPTLALWRKLQDRQIQAAYQNLAAWR